MKLVEVQERLQCILLVLIRLLNDLKQDGLIRLNVAIESEVLDHLLLLSLRHGIERLDIEISLEYAVVKLRLVCDETIGNLSLFKLQILLKQHNRQIVALLNAVVDDQFHQIEVPLLHYVDADLRNNWLHNLSMRGYTGIFEGLEQKMD